MRTPIEKKSELWRAEHTCPCPHVEVHVVRRSVMSTAVMTNRLELNSFAGAALRAAARFWFGVTVIGQVVFALAVASFYGLTARRGDYQSWKCTNGLRP